MVTANTYGRQVVVPLTNKSGGSVAAGDVVIVDTSNNDAFTTDTSGGFTGLVGVAQETIANNATGRVLTSGYAALVNVNASVTRGQYGKTHTVAKQATGTAARGTGTFCQWLTGGTTPDAIVYQVDLLGSSLTNPMTTKGDVLQGDTGGTPVRLGAGTAGQVLSSGGAAAFNSWAVPLPVAHGARVKRSADQSVGNNTLTAIAFTAEDYDTDTIHDNSTNNTRLTIPAVSGVTTGLWSVKASGYVDLATSAVDVQIKLNGTTGIGFCRFQPIQTAGGSGGFPGYVIAIDYVFTAADYVECFVRTPGGSGLAVFDAGISPIFSVAFLGKVT